ncbi:hypothetical protein EON80_04160, partial [bacterium]
MAARPAPTQRAITAAVGSVRSVTGNSAWRYENGRWFTIRINPATGAVRHIYAIPSQAARFDRILEYWEEVFPQPAPPGPRPAGPSPAGSGSRGFAGAGAGSFGTGGAIRRGLSGAASIGAGVIGGAASLGVGAVATGIAGLVAVLKRGTTEASLWADSLATLRANSGLSFAQGNALVARNAVLGIDPATSAQIYGSRDSNPFL